ncbi:hypothetical protein Golob_003499 [Gossypium lobatum]|uniref:Uncharacterized protein n=1 Tax=Gossypium lobatum TaxID=34289 RepID=A0A7J8MYI5_9ROSI|nr:hypothetical protein [Gossypium lobatum]
MSDGNILCGTDSPMSASNVRQESENRGEAISESTHEMPAYGISYSRCVLTVSCFPSFQIAVVGIAPSIARSAAGLSSENIGAELKTGMTTSPSESGSNIKVGERSASEVTCDGLMDGYSESFVNWVTHGDLLIPVKFTCQ